MKKYIGFIVILLVLIFSYLLFINNEEDYKVSYKVDKYDIVESYSTNAKVYTFKVSNDKTVYNFIYTGKYNKDRKIVTKVITKDKNDYECMQLKIDEAKTDFICNNDKEFVTYNIATKENINDDVKMVVDNINVFNKKNHYYIWNGHGITDVIKKINYNFLDKETYDNNLYYKYGNKIIFADYDSKRTFSKFYIFDYDDKSVEEFSFDYKIDFDAYFMGDYDGWIYLFDKKNSVQYKINIKKEKVLVASGKKSGFYYDNEETIKTLKEMKYNNLLFKNDKKFNYLINDKVIYLRYLNSNTNVRFSNFEVDSIVYEEDNTVYYLSGEILYKYTIGKGEDKLLSYFEWNFSSTGKIFIFN